MALLSEMGNVPLPDGLKGRIWARLVKEREGRMTTAAADKWVRSHAQEMERYAGKWVAVAATGVVAVGSALHEIREISERKGFGRHEVIVFKLPVSSRRMAR